LSWKIEFDAGFAKDLKKLGRPAQQRIKKYLDKLQSECANPKERGKPLKANLSGFWKYRVGDYRLLCQIVDGEVILLYAMVAAHRSRSYSDRHVDELIKRATDLKDKA
jgi:mRNA interferase RelE/StbE